ncbi:MAG: CPBP family intramembrane metalloprotease [Calditrichaceae bacterium]|nr:CPBP family intramembrane metalloprotease [Calditrichaceae bacterium]
MSRKPLFWILFTVFTIACGFFAVEFFPKAYPIVAMNVEMDRDQAIRKAIELAEANGWAWGDGRNSASFRTAHRVQNYVELEAGGAEAFRAMIQDTLYSPYFWTVRLFKPSETKETEIYFDPKGDFIGFEEKVPEDEEGGALSADSALSIVHEQIIQKWRFRLPSYELIEKAQQVRPAGRIDHTFTYELKDQKIGEGTYRYEIGVSGDKLTKIKPYIKIPETFDLKYEELRSANETIATGAVIAIVLLYVFGGILFGLFYLLKQRWLVWKKALIWGGIVGFLQAMTLLNEWPLMWMDYDTALAINGFISRQIIMIVLQFIGYTGLFTLIFMVAESLTRKAFPNHIQLWKVWNTKTAASKSVLGQTIGAYYGVAIFFAVDIAFYFFATNVLGWWTPSSALTDPDVLATYFPWLPPIGISLQAGFMEECLFRAIPIAGAVLLGKKYGHPKTWLITAFVIQAAIFGAGHANYANQPAYARLVELIIPSIGLGLVYYYLGLLPGIITHFVYDVVWFALPVFASSASGIWLDQTVIVILAAIPIIVILYALIRLKKCTEVETEDLNSAFMPPPPVEEKRDAEQLIRSVEMNARERYSLIALGLIGLILWFFLTDFSAIIKEFKPGRDQAEAAAIAELEKMNFTVDKPWEIISCIIDNPDLNDRFAYQTGGDSVYRDLLGDFIDPPRWKVRFARFSGTKEEIAEEYHVYVDPQGKVRNVYHKLAESTAGDSLNADSARTIARNYLKTYFNRDPGLLTEITAKPKEHPNRTDWTFEFADSLAYPLKEGQGRYQIRIAGNDIVNAIKYIHIPEDYERQIRNEENQELIMSIAGSVFKIGLYIAAAVLAIMAWSRKKFAVKPFIIVSSFVFIISLIEIINNWSCVKILFSTAQPLMFQQITVIGVSVIGLLFLAVLLGLISGYIPILNVSPLSKKWRFEWLAAGLLIAGITVVIQLIVPDVTPVWPSLEHLTQAVPFLGFISPVTGFMLRVSLFMFLFVALDILTSGWTKKTILYGSLFVLYFILTSEITITAWGMCLLSGLIKGLLYLGLYIVFFKKNMMYIPLTFLVVFILEQIKTAVTGIFPGIEVIAVFSILLLAVVAVYWTQILIKAGEKQE